MTTKPQSTTEEPANASGKPLFPETLTMVACDQCDEAQPWPLRCNHVYVGIHSREYSRISPPSAAPIVDDYEQSGEIILEEEIQAAIAASKERLHWPFTAKHDNCAECDKEYEAPPAAATAAPQQSLLREPVRVDASSPLIVTRNGVPCPDQAAALEEFKQACTARVEQVERTTAEPRYGERTCKHCGKPIKNTPRRPNRWTHIDTASIFCEFCEPTAAPQVSHDLLRDAGAIIIVNEGSAGARVEIRFAELQDAQRLHQALAQMRVAAPVDHDSIPLTSYERILTIEWDKYNARRHELIKAERSRVLSESEVLELFELQWLAGIKRELAKGPHVAAPVEQSDSSIPTCPDCQQGYICEHCGKSIIDYYSGNKGAR